MCAFSPFDFGLPRMAGADGFRWEKPHPRLRDFPQHDPLRTL